jgi:NAD(P)-dependent dehydrogenase (short-subunit alcohol dehydrogenase family)
MAPRVAFVTGASRGIGKACAIELAKAGFDVAISARTVQEGEAREHSSTLKASNTKPLPGSLRATAEEVEKAGAKALLVPADLLDAASLGAAAQRVLDTWGRVDVLVQNGRYIGPGHMDRLLETPIELIQKQLFANVIAPLILDQYFLPGMVERGSGTIIDITSASGYADPSAPAGEGGWGLGYGISKGAFQRIAGFINIEHGKQGVRCFNVQPGFIATERMAADMGSFGFVGGAPAAVVGVVVRWLATSPQAASYVNRTVEAQFLCHELGLLPGWEGPTPNTNKIAYDLSAARLDELERQLAQKAGGRG